MYLYFYVGEFARNSIQQTAGINSELFNGKVDLNASNLNTQGKSYVSGLAMPSKKFTSLTAGASGSTFTAPANGWFSLQGAGTTSFCFMGLIAISESGGDLYANSMVVYQVGNGLDCLLPVKKGQVIKINYYNANVSNFRFFYAEGDAPTESEA